MAEAAKSRAIAALQRLFFEELAKALAAKLSAAPLSSPEIPGMRGKER